MARPTAQDALRLVDAFHDIDDEADWMKVIELAEELARSSRPPEHLEEHKVKH